jgi:hypothetical protein
LAEDDPVCIKWSTTYWAGQFVDDGIFNSLGCWILEERSRR